MKKIQNLFFLLVLTLVATNFVTAQSMTAEMTKEVTTNDKDIVDIALSSDDHTTLVAALKAAGLVSALQADGPFTVFAPTNAAFEALPEGTVATLLKPENKEALTNILTYHVVAGNIDAAAVVKAIKDGNGTATLTALNGGKIEAYLEDGKVFLKDENGGTSQVMVTDLKGNNGVIHVVGAVVLPKS
ncbi:MAG: fasciclin domain-containing protein [Saprospiraceae bacterium]